MINNFEEKEKNWNDKVRKLENKISKNKEIFYSKSRSSSNSDYSQLESKKKFLESRLSALKEESKQKNKMIYEFVKYCDIFGTKFSFYTEEKPKLYSVLGGIFTFVLIFVCLGVFIFSGLDDFKRINPIVTTSAIPSEGYHKIKFGEEKIWIPWRIVDYDNKYINIKLTRFLPSIHIEL